MRALIAALALITCSPALAQWSYPTAPPLRFQVGGTAQNGVTTVNFSAGSLTNGVLAVTVGGGVPAAGSSPFAIGTNLVLSATGLTGARTFLWPDASDTVVTLVATQSLSAKTFTSPTISGTVSGAPTWSAQTFPAATLSNATNQMTLGAAAHVDVISATAPAAASNTLTIPDTAGADTFVFLTLPQTLASKTMSGPTLSGTVAGTPTISSAWTWSSGQAMPTLTASNTTNQLVLGAASHTATITSPAPSGANNTLTIPDTAGSDTFVFTTLAQTVASKTFTAPVINGATSSGSTAIDFSGNSGTFKFPTGGVNATVALSGFTAAVNANGYDLSSGTGIFKPPTGTTTIGGQVIASGSLRPHRVTVADTGYTVLGTDHIIAYTSISAARVVSVNPGTTGAIASPWWLRIVDESGSASGTNTITVTPTSGTINGAASVVCVNAARGFCQVECNGTNCFLF